VEQFQVSQKSRAEEEKHVVIPRVVIPESFRSALAVHQYLSLSGIVEILRSDQSFVLFPLTSKSRGPREAVSKVGSHFFSEAAEHPAEIRALSMRCGWSNGTGRAVSWSVTCTVNLSCAVLAHPQYGLKQL